LSKNGGNLTLMKLQIVSTDELDKTLTVMIDGVRYEYWVKGYYAGILQKVKVLLARKAYGLALNLLKAQSFRCDKLPA
jgi:hypothetical protein